ncbi:glycosyltransferase [Aequorivita flava]|uniref:Glycosyltransferase n=1 Tax=Aequorivita flava TaxID=3114371 RepID=A0AB35YUP1_9FLAO
MKLIFWQNIVSPHQSFLIRELAERHEVILAVLKEVSIERVKQGWSRPDTGRAEVIVLENQQIANKIKENNTDAINIFSGIANYKIIDKVFRETNNDDFNVVIVEAGSIIGWQRHFRKLIYRIKAFIYRDKIDVILAMGNLGAEWYSSVGFSKEKIHRFQYFTELPKIEELNISKLECVSPVFLFIGQLIDRKNIIQLVKAMNGLKSYEWRLNIIGDGPQRTRLKDLITALGLENRITLYGNMDNTDAMNFLVNSDYLVLPSKFDGWGAVINEALSRGVKVITNENCGASCIVKEIQWGIVYRTNNLNDLQKALLNEVINFKRPSMNEKICKSKEFEVNYTLNRVNEFEKLLLDNV